MGKRRSFIKQLSGALFGSLFLSNLPLLRSNASEIPKQIGHSLPEDEFWRFIRNLFPLKKDWVYLNNGTMGPCPYTVVEAVKKSITFESTHFNYGGYDIARESIAKFLKVNQDEISLTHNTTEGINIIAWGMPLKKGDEVIMTSHEHVGNALPWLNRAKLHGIVLKTFDPAMTADENLNRINDLISDKTRAIAVPHITCTTGLVLPIKEIAQLGKDKGLIVSFDGAHGIGSTELDLSELGDSLYASCCHKWLMGPLGTGFLYVKKDMLDTIQAYDVGGYSSIGWELSGETQVLNGFVPTAHRYDYSTKSPALYKGVSSAIDFFNNIGVPKAIARSRSLAKYLQERLLEIEDKVEMLSPVEDASRSCMIGFRLNNMNNKDFGKIAVKNKFRIRLVGESGLNSIRISTHIYNNFDEIDRFVDLIKKEA
jgi:selenocysteine lyase/cysteine desulfurase